jgi:serine phosphatase RsbU (regulator of sigma subunit)
VNSFLGEITEGNSRKKLEKFLGSLFILVIFKILFPIVENSFLIVLNDLLIYSTLALSFIYFSEIVNTKNDNPIALVLNVGILSAILFFFTTLSSALFDKIENIEEVNGVLYTLVSVIISHGFLLSSLIVLATLQLFYSLKQKRISRNYFNYLLIAIVLASFSSTISGLNASLQFIEKSFFIVAIVLIVFNSFRVSWIAFQTRKEKIFLLFLSIIMSALFGLNFAMFSETNIIEQIVFHFSPGARILYTLIMLYGNIYFGIVFFTTLFHLPTAGVFDQKTEEITSLIDLSKLMTQVLDFKELADGLTDATNKICNSDSAWIIDIENDKKNLISVNNIGYIEAQDISNELLNEFQIELKEILALNKKVIKVKKGNDVRAYVFQAILIAPLKVHGKTNGYLFAAKRQKYKFDKDENRALGAFADYAAVAMENAKLIKSSMEKERMENELEVARNIQSRLLPSKSPACESLEVDSLFVPAFEVGGDYYDYFQLDENRLAFVIADVSGKGVVASYVMAEVKGIFESLSKVISEPRELLIATNDILKESLSRNSFVTALYGIIDKEKGLLNFARAGHMPLLICSNGKVKDYLPKGIGLGLDFGKNFDSNIENMEIKLNNNDIMLLYTDGVTESRNSKNEEFGFERFKDIIEKNYNNSLEEITGKIFEGVSVFSKEEQQHDDITLVLFKWNNFIKPLEKLNG